jgi:tetratricopeptide (TPR) repeat protein
MQEHLAAPTRVIRVFVSSTFRDMQGEREELVKRVFPQLRKLCEERDVTWGEVDLRWGVTDEQKAEGKVLPICLAEIQHCRPYFIGLLGERYGWVPDALPPQLVEEEPWLGGHTGHSVTELEILHGVLNNPAMAGHALFYFRDPTFIDTLPAEQQSEYLERPTAEDIATLGRHKAEHRAGERKAKLEALKDQIRAGKLPLRENYPTPRALGEMVLRDVSEIVNAVYPADQRPDPLDRAAAEHEAFASSRARVYIGRQAYFDRLDAHAQGDGPPLVVLGESGLGKSALLANWAIRYRMAHPDTVLVQHFIGATPDSADWAAMLRRVLRELKRHFGLTLEIPDKPDALRMAFANGLHIAGAQGRLVLILDALNQLEDRDQALDLVWLPPGIPANVRLILSTLPGRPLDDVKKRDWPMLQVQPLTTTERERLVHEYLAQYTKSLSGGRVARIAAAPQTANPLYLRALLEELRLWHQHETLEGRTDYYLSAASVTELYRRILERYEQDYERDRPGLVRDAMSLVWAARRGLSEAELMDLLGSDGQPLPRAHWSPLYLAAEQSLFNRSGLIGFSHDYFRQAVRERYLSTEPQERAAHLRLADYFEARELGDRKVDELPWQLAEARAWERLGALLAEPLLFVAAWERSQFEVKAYWSQVEGHSQVRMVEAYRSVMETLSAESAHAWRVSLLFGDTGHLEEALSLRKGFVEHYREVGDKAKLSASLGNQATILHDLGKLDEAMALLKEQERLSRELGDKAGLQASLGNQALILNARGERDEAMALLKEEVGLCRELGDKAALSGTLGNQAGILFERGELDGAMGLYKEQERLCRELGDKAELSGSLGNQASILCTLGELDGAMAFYKEQEDLCRELGDKAGLQTLLGNKATVLYRRGDLDGSMAFYKEQEDLSRDLGNKASLSLSLGNQALILATRVDLDGAMALYKEQERLCRELGDTAGLQVSLGGQASILQEQGNLDEAMGLYKEQERLCRELGDKARLARCLGGQALILNGWSHALGPRVGPLLRDDALALHKEAVELDREVGDPGALAGSLASQAILLGPVMHRSREALPLAEEAFRIATDHGLTALAPGIKRVLDEVRAESHSVSEQAPEVVRPQMRDRRAGLDAGRQRNSRGWLFYVVHSTAALGLIAVGIVGVQKSSWLWLLGILLVVLGAAWLTFFVLIVTNTYVPGNCPRCGQVAFIWRGRLKCPNCENEEASRAG